MKVDLTFETFFVEDKNKSISVQEFRTHSVEISGTTTKISTSFFGGVHRLESQQSHLSHCCNLLSLDISLHASCSLSVSIISSRRSLRVRSSNGKSLVWGLVVWIPRILLCKGLLLRDIPIRIPNHRAPNHQFTGS